MSSYRTHRHYPAGYVSVCLYVCLSVCIHPTHPTHPTRMCVYCYFHRQDGLDGGCAGALFTKLIYRLARRGSCPHPHAIHFPGLIPFYILHSIFLFSFLFSRYWRQFVIQSVSQSLSQLSFGPWSWTRVICIFRAKDCLFFFFFCSPDRTNNTRGGHRWGKLSQDKQKAGKDNGGTERQRERGWLEVAFDLSP